VRRELFKQFLSLLAQPEIIPLDQHYREANVAENTDQLTENLAPWFHCHVEDRCMVNYSSGVTGM